MAESEPDLLIIGAGIAGASAAYFASRRGTSSIVVDVGVHAASTVPTALINPMRGYQGKIAPRGVEGARFSFDLIDALVAAGHTIPHRRGLWRPAPDIEVRDLWRSNFSGIVPHRWHDEVPSALGLRGAWAGVLYLPDSGWVETRPLVDALLGEAIKHSCERLQAEVVDVDPVRCKLRLRDGSEIGAKRLLWCGGAWGASRMGFRAGFRPGSLIVTDTRLSDEAISFGLYTAPYGQGSVIGPTTEPIASAFDDGPSPAAWLSRTRERASAMFVQPFEVKSVWHGVRLEAATLPPGLPHLTGFGSRGYLMAPLLAYEWLHRQL